MGFHLIECVFCGHQKIMYQRPSECESCDACGEDNFTDSEEETQDEE